MTTPRDTEHGDRSAERQGSPQPQPQPTQARPTHGHQHAPGTPPPRREEATTVLPAAGGGRRPGLPARPPVRGEGRPASTSSRPTARTRRARLALRRIDPWSVFLFSLVASVFLGIALVVAVAVLYAVLGTLGVTESVNQLFAEVTGSSLTEDALLTSGRIIGGAVVLAAVNVVFLTLLATLGAMLYNLCASFTGGIELTLGERD